MSDFLTITALSDTHELHRELDRLPGGDLLIHGGDFSMFSKSWAAIEDFTDWMAEQPYRHKVVIYGNHEFAFESEPGRRSVFEREGIIVPHDEGVEVEGLKIWGSPVTPLYGTAFGMSSAHDRLRLWSRIPTDTDVLVTHGPPYGILDRVPGSKEHLGDKELLSAVRQIQPRLHLFGHIHGAYGVFEQDGTTYCNVALLGVGGDIEHQPVTLILPHSDGSTISPSAS